MHQTLFAWFTTLLMSLTIWKAALQVMVPLKSWIHLQIINKSYTHILCEALISRGNTGILFTVNLWCSNHITIYICIFDGKTNSICMLVIKWNSFIVRYALKIHGQHAILLHCNISHTVNCKNNSLVKIYFNASWSVNAVFIELASKYALFEVGILKNKTSAAGHVLGATHMFIKLATSKKYKMLH